MLGGTAGVTFAGGVTTLGVPDDGGVYGVTTGEGVGGGAIVDWLVKV